MKLDIKQFINESLTSNAYVVRRDDFLECVLVDIGEYAELKKHISLQGLSVKGLFLTHSHYDHILGIKEFMHEFPDATIFAHEYTIKSLANSKLNVSFYRDLPIEVEIPPENQNTLVDDVTEIASLKIKSLYTPGHNLGSLSFLIGDFLFTGDSLVPGHKIVTKLKGGNREQAKTSLLRLIGLLNKVRYLAPGHGSIINPEEFELLISEQKSLNS